MGDPSVRARVEAGSKAASRLGIGSTPTLLVDGWKFVGTERSAEQLLAVVDAIANSPASASLGTDEIVKALATARR